jgi:F-type H+-transporting ATPase subunit delta
MQAAERYVGALFDLAEQEKALDQAAADLAAIREAFKNKDVQLAAGSPRIDPAERGKAFAAVAEALGLSPLARRFVGVVAQNGRAPLLPLIADQFEQRLAEHRGERRVEIIAAQPMEPAQLQSLTASLSAALGKQVRPTVRIDERLIGGFIARAGSRQFDASIKSKLDALAVQLTSQR